MIKTRPMETQSQAEQRRQLAQEIVQGRKKDEVFNYLTPHLEDESLRNLDVLAALYKVCEKLKPLAGHFKVIVSDEASARIPSLIIKDVLDAVRKKEHLPPLTIRFLVAGASSDQQKTAVEEYIRQNAPSLDQALLVTEYIETGNGIANLLQLFSRHGLHPMVAAVSMQLEPNYYRSLLPITPVYGAINKAGLSFYGLAGRFRSGVTKKNAQARAHPERFKDVATSEKGKADVQKVVNTTRSDAALVAEVFSAYLLR
jgi:hypothetical protein